MVKHQDRKLAVRELAKRSGLPYRSAAKVHQRHLAGKFQWNDPVPPGQYGYIFQVFHELHRCELRPLHANFGVSTEGLYGHILLYDGGHLSWFTYDGGWRYFDQNTKIWRLQGGTILPDPDSVAEGVVRIRRMPPHREPIAYVSRTFRPVSVKAADLASYARPPKGSDLYSAEFGWRYEGEL